MSVKTKDVYADLPQLPPDAMSKTMDRLEDFSAPIVASISTLQSAYASNSSMIIAALGSKTMADITAPLQGVLSALDALKGIHPFISVAVVAFKAVVTLELKRRANDKRIAAVYAAIIDMLSVLFELADVKELDRPAPNGGTMKGRLITSLESSHVEIKTAANSIDKYSKSKFVVKLIKANSWEDKLIGHTKTFADRKADFQFAMQIHTTVAVDKMQAQVQDMTAMLAQVLKHQSAKEKEIEAFIEAKGGRECVLEDDELLLEVTIKCDEKDGAGTQWDKDKRGAPKTIDASLRHELTAPLDDLLKANEALFAKKLDAQTDVLIHAMDLSSERVIKALRKGPYERVEDPDLRALWREERWRSSVKARHLIIALHDYFSSGVAHVRADPESPDEGVKLTLLTPGHPDAWTLDFMNVFYATAIQDAFDDDGSGFVSITEVNEFTQAKPADISLPVWIAYWAAGWYLDCAVYEKKITAVISKMKELAENVLDENKEKVQKYLDNQIEYAEKLSTWGAEEDSPQLLEMTRNRRHAEEARIRKNLEDIKFEIDGSAAVFAVCGTGRVDKYLLPLTFLLLERHAQIITLCNEYIVDEREFELATDSLWYVVEEVWNRVSMLKEGFNQQRLDLDTTFEYFCNGLYNTWYMDYFRNADSDSDSDSEDEEEDEDTDGESAEGGEDAAEGGEDESEDSQDEEDDHKSLATTAPEEILPLSVELLRYPATKAEKEAIAARKAKEEEAKKKAEEDDEKDGEDEEETKEAEVPKKTVEERLEALEEKMTSIQDSLKELLLRLPPKRR